MLQRTLRAEHAAASSARCGYRDACCLAKPLVPPAAPKRVEARTAAAAMNEKAAAERSPDGPRGARPRSRSRSRDRSASEEEPPRRFERGDRVVCCIGGEWGWAAGVVNAVDEQDPQDRRNVLPYIVKLDPPVGKLISVPVDSNRFCRPEICFDEYRPGGAEFAIKCAPTKAATRRARRFVVGDRVSVAVEDDTDAFSDWAAGVVLSVDHAVGVATLPYRVKLDEDARTVLVHRDEHWLVRDAGLQANGPRQRPGGRRTLDKFVKRRAADGATWEMVDHATRKVRPLREDPGDDDDDE